MPKNKSLFLILIFFLFVKVLAGQNDSLSVSNELEKLFGRLIENYGDSVRIRINDSIKTIVDQYVESDTIFFHRFSKVRYLGQVTSPDSLLKIVTWNLVLKHEPSRYFSYFIRKSENGKTNTIYRLSAAYDSTTIRSDTTYSTDNWYGALYYDIRPQIISGKNCWVLLGIDYGNPEITRKIIEIITFDREGRMIFGLNTFSMSDRLSFREIFEYSATATMTLRFSGDDSIVFDHLVPFDPELINHRQYYGPNYSTDAFVLENGLWKIKLDVDARNKDKIILQH